MIRLARIVSGLALAAIVAAPILFYAQTIGHHATRVALLAATIAWFASSAWRFFGRGSGPPGDAGRE